MADQSAHIAPGSKYIVQQGDTLWTIAQRAYGDAEDWDTIYNANKHVVGSDPNLIKPGQVLTIPQQSDPGPAPAPRPTPTPTPTPPPPPPTPPNREDNDSPLDWIENELGEKKED